MITRSLTKQLGGEPAYAAEVATLIAAGDLSQPVAVQAGDDHSLLAAMEKMRASLVQIVSEVRSGTDTIATAAGEISSGKPGPVIAHGSSRPARWKRPRRRWKN